MAEDEPWLALLEAEDVEGLNGRRTERTRIEAFAADLAGKKLAGVDLSGATLEKSDLTGADLTDANLARANLAGIDASGAILKDVMGIRVRLKDAFLDEADLSGADLTGADMADANLVRSRADGARLGQARLRGIDATDAVWPRVVLTEAKLHQAKFVRADLRNAELSDAGAMEADFSGARLDGVNAAGAKFGTAKFVGAHLVSARLVGANLAGADLTGADLGTADLTRANLTGAVLTNAILRGAVLADANLEGANLTGADLTDADLSGLDPTALGLAADVVSSLSGFGVAHDDDAPLVFGEVSVARSGAAVAVVWPNPEGEPQPVQPADGEVPVEGEEPELEQPLVMRYAVRSGGAWVRGVMPVPGDAVLDHRVVAVADGFLIVVVRSRPEGASLVCARLDAKGVLGSVRTTALGYDPMVRAVFQIDGPTVRMFGLARRGPTLVVHDLTGEAKVVGSHQAATARGFLGSHPVMGCKGGVVVRVSSRGPAPPRRTPEGFPGTTGTALPFGDDMLALWAVKRTPTVPGGVRFAVIGKRHAPREEPLARAGAVMALAAVEGPVVDDTPSADAYWVEMTATGTRLVHVRVGPEGGDARVLPAPEDIAEVEVAPGVIAVVTAEGRLVAIDPAAGKVLGEL